MKQELERQDEYVFRIKLRGPEDFEDARFIKELFVTYAQFVMAAQNVHEIIDCLHDLHEIDRWLQCTWIDFVSLNEFQIEF